MKRLDVKELWKRYEKSKTQKELFRKLYEDCYLLAIPDRNLYTHISPGQIKTAYIYDSSGISSVNKYVNRLTSGLTPPYKKWVSLSAGPAYENDNGLKKIINEALQILTDTAFEILNHSNFNSVITQYYLDLCVGTAVLVVQPGTDEDFPLRFSCVPIEQVSIEAGPDSSVGAVYRSYKMEGILLKETWADAKIPADVQERIKQNPMAEVELLECNYGSNGRYYYDVILKNSRARIVERQSATNRWIVTRVNLVPGEVYGRGPLVQALPDLKMLNKAKELAIKSAQMNAYGIWTCSDSDVINSNTVSFTPGSIIPVSRNGGPNGPSLAPLPLSGNIDLQQLMAEGLQEQIKDLMMIVPLPPETGQVRTATEIDARIRDYRLNTDSSYGRLMYEFVQPLWQAIINILDEKGLITLPPELQKIDNFRVKIKVLSPIAKEQNYEDVQNVVQAVQLIANSAGPELTQLAFKMEELAEWICEKLGVPATLYRNEDERLEKVQQLQQMQQQLAANADEQQLQLGA